MAELIIDRIPEFGSIFLCAGNPKWDAHSLIVKGFDDYLAENRCPNLVYKDYSYSINRQKMCIRDRSRMEDIKRTFMYHGSEHKCICLLYTSRCV